MIQRHYSSLKIMNAKPNSNHVPYLISKAKGPSSNSWTWHISNHPIQRDFYISYSK